MPAIDNYQSTQLDDENSIEAFLLAHVARHQSYAYAASLAGVSLQLYNFWDYPDDTWFANHASAHQVLAQFSIPDQSIDQTVLTNYAWDNQDDFATWMKMHTLIHQRIDQYFGMF
jgi:hypothetical protein